MASLAVVVVRTNYSAVSSIDNGVVNGAVGSFRNRPQTIFRTCSTTVHRFIERLRVRARAFP